VCHLKGITEFDDSAKLSEINAKENLIGLCPNHHWEYDNGLLTLEEISIKMSGSDVVVTCLPLKQ
jgi:hypothetical protein